MGYSNQGSENGGQESKEKSFGAKFKIRGLVCQNRDKNGNALTVSKTKNGKDVVSLSVLVNKYFNTGRRDETGKAIWDKNQEFYNLVAFGNVAEDLMRDDVKVYSIMDFVGTISTGKNDRGETSFKFVIESYSLISAAKSNPQASGGRTYDNRGGNGGGNRPQERGGNYSGGGARSYSYNDRPHNDGRRQAPANTPPPAPPEDDGGPIAGVDDDIPF